MQDTFMMYKSNVSPYAWDLKPSDFKGHVSVYILHDKVAHNLLLLYRGSPQAQWKLFIVQQGSLLPDAKKSIAPPTLLTAGLQNMQTDTASLDSQSPVNLAPANANITCHTLSLPPICPSIRISRYFGKHIRQ